MFYLCPFANTFYILSSTAPILLLLHLPEEALLDFTRHYARTSFSQSHHNIEVSEVCHY